jgi:hypothetical protein
LCGASARRTLASGSIRQFGVCATASSDAHCTVDPATVPKAMDVLTPAGVAQSSELDYTQHATVTIAPVVIP